MSGLDGSGAVHTATPELTRDNRKSQFHEFTGKLTSNVNFIYLSRDLWLQLPNLIARRRIKGGTGRVWRGSYVLAEALGGHVPPGAEYNPF